MDPKAFQRQQLNTQQLSITSFLTHDIEKTGDYFHLSNEAVKSFAWENVTVGVKDRQTGSSRNILQDSRGAVHAGEMLAIMGPRYGSLTQKH